MDFKKSGARIWTSAVLGINTTSAELKNSEGWDGVYLFRVTAVDCSGISEYGTVSVELKGLSQIALLNFERIITFN